MAADDFFNRWSKRNAAAAAAAGAAQALPDPGPDPVQDAQPGTPAVVEQKPLPTLEDVANLTHDSDFSGFMAQGVDESVKRSAMKKLFSNPHFNVMDGLDIYIDDYSKFEPITPAFLAQLNHAKALLDPLSQFQAPLMQLLDKVVEKAEAQAEAEVDGAAQIDAQATVAQLDAAAPGPEIEPETETDPETGPETGPETEPEAAPPPTPPNAATRTDV